MSQPVPPSLTGQPVPNTLLATIQKNSAQLAGTQAPATNNVGQVQSLLAAKSGKADAAGVGNISSVGEQAANSATQNQLTNQVAPAIQGQQAQTDIQAAQQTSQYNQQSAQVAQAAKFNTAQNQIQVQSLMQGLTAQKGDLQTQENQAKLEQVSFLLSMQNKQYVQNLQYASAYQRLGQQSNFQETQEKLAFGSSLQVLSQQLEGQDVLALSQIDYNNAISKMSVDQALQIGDLERQDAADAANTQMQLEQYKSNQAAALSGIQAAGQGAQGLLAGGLAAGNAAANGKFTSTSADTSSPTTGIAATNIDPGSVA